LGTPPATTGQSRLPHPNLSAMTDVSANLLPRGYLQYLDGLRAVAVTAVVIGHTNHSWLPGGHVAVDTFFVVSGFIVTAMLIFEFEKTGRIHFGRFYMRRALRLMPALLVVSAFCLVVLGLLPVVDNPGDHRFGVLTALTFTSSPVAAGDWHEIGAMLPTWSLSVEEYYYFLWPVLFLLALRTRHRLALTGLVVALAVAYRLIAAWGTDWSDDRLYYGADTRAEQLMIGCFLAVLMARRRLPIRAWHGWVAATLLATYVVGADHWSQRFYYEGGGSTLVAVAAAVLVASLVNAPADRMAGLLSLGPVVWLGHRSYGVYVWDPVLGVALAPLLAHAPTAIPLFPVTFALTVVVAGLSFRYVEAPALKLKSRFGFMSAPRPRPAAPAPATPSGQLAPEGAT
jgi:peptidoglycan/LPS O-acetylase OafA/YrhL